MVLQILGAVVVVAVLQDVFFTVLFPASGHGVLRRPLSRWTWRFFQVMAGWLRSRRRRLGVLAYSGPVQITVTLGTWILLLALGWAMIFQPALGKQITATSGSTDTGWAAALYYSGYNLTTLGVGDLVAHGKLYRILTVTESAIGFAVLSMAITYFLSVYSTLVQRRTSAARLHSDTYQTGDAAHLLVGIAVTSGSHLSFGELGRTVKFVQRLYESHSSYPVLRYFHFRRTSYALPRILLVALDTSALINTTLPPPQPAGRAPEVSALSAAARELLDELIGPQEPPPTTRQEQARWRHRHQQAVQTLASAGVPLVDDLDLAADAYVTERGQWDGQLRRLAQAMRYDWVDVEQAVGGDEPAPR